MRSKRRAGEGRRVGSVSAVVAALGMALLVIAPRPVAAQEGESNVDSSAAHRDRQSVWTVWSATAHSQPLATRLGYRYDRGLVIVGLQKRWPLHVSRSGSLQLDYTMDLIPVVLSSEMPEYVTQTVPCGAGSQRGCRMDVSVLSGNHTAQGAGAAPLGLVGRWRLSPSLGLQLHASGGMLYFSRIIPDPLGCQLNFTADAGLAADIRVMQKVGLLAGWRLNHISNGGRGKVNPGMNSRMIELGLSLAP